MLTFDRLCGRYHFKQTLCHDTKNDFWILKMNRKVAIISGKELHTECSKIERIRSRGSMVNELIKAYGLMKYLHVVNSQHALEEDLTSFHSKEYVDYLKGINNSTDLEKNEEENEFGLGYDCPVLKSIYSFVTAIAGGSLTAADLLIKESASIVINWYGGWHHAQRDEAEGFCYVNDIVCAIQRLRKKFSTVLYIDLDIHHGNGVQNAFEFTPKVMTLSFHKYEPGFYPGTGALNDIGRGTGRFYSVNVPLRSGIRDAPYCSVFDSSNQLSKEHKRNCVSIAEAAVGSFRPEAVVVQCGADCLNCDPLGTFNLSLHGVGHCVKRILSWNLPTLFLGGGGYNLPNVARCWTYLTSIIVGHEISTDIPENPFFPRFGPDFELHISPGNRPDENSKEYLEEIKNTILNNLGNIV